MMERDAAVVVGMGVPRVELDGAVELRERLAEPAEAVAEHRAATVVAVGVPRVDLEGPVVGRERLLEAAQVLERDAAVVVGQEVQRVDR